MTDQSNAQGSSHRRSPPRHGEARAIGRRASPSECLDAIEAAQPGAQRVRAPRRRPARSRPRRRSTRGSPRATTPARSPACPFGVKDLDDCAGMPTTHGSRWYLGRPPVQHDALHVARLRAVARSRSARPRHPSSARSRTPPAPRSASPATRGIPSARRAARAVARPRRSPRAWCRSRRRATAADRPARRPASAASSASSAPTVAFPTAIASRYAQTAVPGALATTVADSARLLDVMAGPHRRDRSSLPAPDRRLRGCDRDPRRRRPAHRVVERSRLRGRRPEVAEIAHDAFEALVAARQAQPSTAARSSSPTRSPCGRKIRAPTCGCTSPTAAGRNVPTSSTRACAPASTAAARVTLPKFGAVLRERLAIEDAMADLFDTVDVLATPMAAIPAFAAEGPMPTEILGPARARGHVGAVRDALEPLGLTGDLGAGGRHARAGMPVGLQLMADRHRDDVCLRLARVLEQARPWPRHAPRVAQPRAASRTFGAFGHRPRGTRRPRRAASTRRSRA